MERHTYAVHYGLILCINTFIYVQGAPSLFYFAKYIVLFDRK